MVLPFSKFYAKIWVGFCLNTGKHFFLEVSFWSHQKEHRVCLKNGIRDFRNSTPFERSVCLYVTISVSFERFEYFNFERVFLENETFLKKHEYQRLKMHHFHTKLPYQKPMLRQNEWRVLNGPITKNGFLPVTTSFFWKFCFSLKTSYKGLI